MVRGNRKRRAEFTEEQPEQLFTFSNTNAFGTDFNSNSNSTNFTFNSNSNSNNTGFNFGGDTTKVENNSSFTFAQPTFQFSSFPTQTDFPPKTTQEANQTATQQQFEAEEGVHFKFLPSDVLEDLRCNICNQIFRKPVLLACGDTFCKSCVDLLRGTDNKIQGCPQCFKMITMEVPAGNVVQKILDKLKVECTTCCTVMNNCDLFKHCWEDCPIHCPNNCGATFPRSAQYKHEQSECSQLPVFCSANDIGCCFKARGAELEEHQSQCPFIALRPTLSDMFSELTILKEEFRLIKQEKELKQMQTSFRFSF